MRRRGGSRIRVGRVRRMKDAEEEWEGEADGDDDEEEVVEEEGLVLMVRDVQELRYALTLDP